MKAALAYAGLGWRVLPLHDVRSGACSCGKPDCKSAGKHPREAAWQKTASNDPATITGWWAAWPNANVGIATGEASGFFVLDVDPDKGGDESLATLIAHHGDLPHTPRARTGSGGAHYLFALPNFPVTNTAGKIALGIDTRGNGGQIVAAPSRSAKGLYSWEVSPLQAPLAQAPAWILEKLRTSAPVAVEGDGTSSVLRGHFPAASISVLDAARVALERHGPAIEGQGGDQHTVQAAAILTHDYALTDDEAWPLFCAWNETCQPPWNLEGRDSLRSKLANGRKYGKAEYGKRRTLDLVETAQRAIANWYQATPKPPMEDVLKVVRECARLCDDWAKHEAIKGEAKVLGVGVKGLDLPDPENLPKDPLPEGSVLVTPKLSKIADDATKVLAPNVFARNGALCEVVKAERTFVADLKPARIRDLLSAGASWVRRADDGGIVEQAPPPEVCEVLHARRTHPVPLRVIEAVTTAPIFLADGSILQTRGYNTQARVFLEPSVHVDVPDEPSQNDARWAVRQFVDLLRDFRFASRADFSSWFAGLLTPLVKAATGNAPAPLFCVSASTPGAGKSLLTEVVANIVTGGNAEIRPYNPRDPGEWGKRLTSFVKAASPVSVFDNVNGPIGDEGLDRLITSSTWSDRILGASDAPPLPNVSAWWATGNNIEPIGDTVRRVLMVRIEVDVERPQERTGFKYPELARHALEHRGDFLSAALTVLRAYHVAGRPSQSLPTWGSFQAWSDLVRGACVWAGLPDPFETQRRASAELNEPENEQHDFWISVVDDSIDGLPTSVISVANSRNAEGVLGLRDPITTFTLKKFIARFVDKPRGGRRIRRERDPKGQVRYAVQRITSAS